MAGGGFAADFVSILKTFYSEYISKTSARLKIMDVFVVFQLATAAVQFLYMLLVGSFPFNAFLAGFLVAIGSAVLTVCLRMQVNSDNKDFKGLAPERAFADYVCCSVLLHLVSINFIG